MEAVRFVEFTDPMFLTLKNKYSSVICGSLNHCWYLMTMEIGGGAGIKPLCLLTVCSDGQDEKNKLHCTNNKLKNFLSFLCKIIEPKNELIIFWYIVKGKTST